jgi:hypothetical protein
LRGLAGVLLAVGVGDRDLGGVDGDVGLAELAELAQLRVREGRLLGAAAAEDHNLLDAAA